MLACCGNLAALHPVLLLSWLSMHLAPASHHAFMLKQTALLAPQDQHQRDRPVRAHADCGGGRLVRQLPRGVHGARLRHQPGARRIYLAVCDTDYGCGCPASSNGRGLGCVPPSRCTLIHSAAALTPGSCLTATGKPSTLPQLTVCSPTLRFMPAAAHCLIAAVSYLFLYLLTSHSRPLRFPPAAARCCGGAERQRQCRGQVYPT